MDDCIDYIAMGSEIFFGMKGKIVFKITEFYQFKIVECKFLYIWHVKIKKMAHKNYLQIVLSLVIILCIMAVKVSNAQT